MSITRQARQQLLAFQKNEITEHMIYRNLAARIKTEENRQVLERIAADELRHYNVMKTHTGEDVRPDRFRIWFYYLVNLVFGFTFGIKLMESGEGDAQENYQDLLHIPEMQAIIRDENEHEASLVRLLDEERLRYTGSMVLGLNDALVELTGALAGLTLALQDTRLIALTGSITGIAAALSMAASEYLSTKAEDATSKSPLKAALYTGVAYIFTVIILILPYLVLGNYFLCLGFTLTAAVLIIAFFNYYISVAKDLPFRKRFFEMAGISLGVACLSFFIGLFIRTVLGVEV